MLSDPAPSRPWPTQNWWCPAEPWNGVATDFDIYITNSAGTVLTRSERNNPNTQTPFEFVSYTNSTGANQALNVVINRYSGTAIPRLRMMHQRTSNVVALEYGAPSAEVLPLSIYGHNGAEKAGSTAANPFNDAQTPEPFSSRGKPVLYFGPVSGPTPAPPLASPRVLNKPDYSTTDGACNTFFIGGQDPDGCYRFFGTSAAAPHAAGVAALLRQAEPALTEPQVQDRLRDTAAPMANGTVLSVGAGRIDALDALGSTGPTPTPTPTPVVTPTLSPAPGAVTTTTTLSVTKIPLPFGGGFTIPSATVAPSNAVGTIQFKDGATNLGAPVPVSGGYAFGGLVSLPPGPHSLTAVFTPSNPAAFKPSTSNTVAFTF